MIDSTLHLISLIARDDKQKSGGENRIRIGETEKSRFLKKRGEFRESDYPSLQYNLI